MASASLTESPRWRTQIASPGPTIDSIPEKRESSLSGRTNKDAILLVVSTGQGLADEDEEQTTRIISVRKATKYEKDWYNFGRA
jgi:uncharacterized DUF497 family protein